MKCSNCGAEIGNNRFCSFCGAQISADMLREQELFNKQGCPKCGSTNTSFRRENQGEIRGKHSNQVIHQTVGFCKDCGYTWYPNGKEKKRKTWLWVLGWIFIFPLPLTLILVKKKEMNPVLKYGIIVIAWLLYIIIAFSGKTNQDVSEPIAESTSVSDIEKQDASESDTVESAEESESKTVETELTFILSWDEPGEYGKKIELNADTDEAYTCIAFYIPAGTYRVTNKMIFGSSQVSVYSGIEFDGVWEQFVANDCATPIVVIANEEAKTIKVKEGQFVKLSDKSTDVEFVLIDK